MSAIPIWHGRFGADGRFEYAETERDQRRVYFQSLAGQDVEVTVRKERTRRTLDQNAYIHAVPVPMFAEEWGEDIETTKLLLLGECFGWRETQYGRVPTKPSTAALSVDDMSHFIEWMPPWGMTNFRMNIPLPGEAE